MADDDAAKTGQSADATGGLDRARQLRRDGRILEALRLYDQMIDRGFADAAIWSETGSALSDIGEYAQALGAFEQTLQVDPDHVEAHNNFARALYNLGAIDRAVSHLRRAIELADSPVTWMNLATLIPSDPAASAADIRDVRRKFSEKLAGGRAAAPRPCRDGKARLPRPLRVGYVSAFFHSANYMKPVWALINHHDRRRVAVQLFSDSPPNQEFGGYQPQPDDQVHSTASLDNLELARLIRRARIDLLVDLNSYSVPARLELLLSAPAPVTAAWFNAYATTGLPGIDNLIGDEDVISAGEEQFFTERVLRLPLSYLTFEVTHPAPPVAPAPCQTDSVLTFGSLVAQYKITPPVLDAWTEILRQAPASRLLLANTALKSAENRKYLLTQFAQRGIPEERLLLLGPAPHYRYLEYYDQIDVALDAFPYNGGTTTMEALWQGVPVLTFNGDRWAARTSQTLIRRTPWKELVADDVAGYVEAAVRFATSADSRSALTGLRRVMRDQLASSAACDGARLAAGMEDLYQQMFDEKSRP